MCALSLATAGFRTDDGSFWQRSFERGEVMVLHGVDVPTMIMVTEDDRESPPVAFHIDGREEEFAAAIGVACSRWESGEWLAGVVTDLERTWHPREVEEVEEVEESEARGPIAESEFAGWACKRSALMALTMAMSESGFRATRRPSRFMFKSADVDAVIDIDRRRGALRLSLRDTAFEGPNVWWVRIGEHPELLVRTLFDIVTEFASVGGVDLAEEMLFEAFPDTGVLTPDGLYFFDKRRADDGVAV